MNDSEKIGDIIRSAAELRTIIEEIALERVAQIDREGFSLAHDDEHNDGSLAGAAAAYALAAAAQSAAASHSDGLEAKWLKLPTKVWPESWDVKWWKPKDRRKNLIRAAALILAELQRIDREASAG